MAKFEKDEYVTVPAAKLDMHDGPAMVQRKVTWTDERSIMVDGEPGENKKIGSSLAHKRLGITLVRIGDIKTELSALDPLARGLKYHFRLLLDGDSFKMWYIRTADELERYWETDGGTTSHLVIVGHGNSNSLKFLDQELSPEDLGKILDKPPSRHKVDILSLACETGKTNFGRPISRYCKTFMAPKKKIHSADAFRFTNAYFAKRLLEGLVHKTAFNHASNVFPKKALFSHWVEGNDLTKSPGRKPTTANG